MFKKAKLYSLLAIIVASTLVSLSSFVQTSFAQPGGATWGEQGGDSKDAITYNGDSYDRIGRGGVRIQVVECDANDIPTSDHLYGDNPNVFAHYVDRAGTENDSASIIYFDAGLEDPNGSVSYIAEVGSIINAGGVPSSSSSSSSSSGSRS